MTERDVRATGFRCGAHARHRETAVLHKRKFFSREGIENEREGGFTIENGESVQSDSRARRRGDARQMPRAGVGACSRDGSDDRMVE